MSKILRSWLVVVLILGFGYLMMDLTQNTVHYNEDLLYFLLCDGVFIFGAFLLVIGIKVGLFGIWVSAAMNLYWIMYKQDKPLLDSILSGIHRFLPALRSDPAIGTYSVCLALLIIVIPLLTTIWVQNNQSIFK